MHRWILMICLLAFAAGCSTEPAKPPAKIEPTAEELRILRLYNHNPDSERGQRELRKMRRNQAEIERVQKQEAEAIEARQRERRERREQP